MLRFLTFYFFALLTLAPNLLFGNNVSAFSGLETTNPPTINVQGSNPYILEVGTPYTELGATVSDPDESLDPNLIEIQGVPNINIIGTYTIVYTIEDSDGNVANATREVRVEDNTPPTLSITGSTTITVQAGLTYTDEGATANDIVDGNLTTSIVIQNNVNTSLVGTYTVTYNVQDSSGNAAPVVSRTVTVEDTTSPEITLLGDAVVTQEVKTSYVDDGATALDNLDGNITGNIVTVNAVDSNTVDTYIVTYNVSDNQGNTANQVVRTVNIVDTTPPDLSLIGNPTITLEVGTAYSELGANASDNYDVNISGNIIIVSLVDNNTVGTYNVTYNISDASGNAATEVIRTVNVIDTTGPVISLIGDAAINLEAGEPYIDDGATAADAGDGNLTTNIATVNTVNTGIPATYTITYNVSDAFGNAAIQMTRTVTVEDTTAPTITLLSNDAPLIIPFGGVYTEPSPSYTTSDNSDSVVTVNSTGNVNTNATGSYTISYTASDSSSNTQTETRTVFVGPQAIAGSDKTVCDSEALYLGSNTADPSYSYQWTSAPAIGSADGPVIDNPGSPYTRVVPQLTTLFTLTVTTTVNGQVLEETDDVLITVIENPEASVVGNTEICLGESISIGAPAVAGSTYSWTSNPPGFNSVLANPTVSPTENIVYTLIETKTASTNCSETNSVAINVAIPAEVFTGPSDSICESETGAGYRLDQATSSILPPNITYQWATLAGDGTFDVDNTLNPIYFPGPTDILNGQVTLQLTGTPAGTCATTPDVSTMVLTIVPALTAEVGVSPVELCENSAYQLNGVVENYASIAWSSSGTPGTLTSGNTLTPTYTPSAADVANGSVTLTMTASPIAPCGGDISNTVVIQLTPAPEAFAGANKTICDGDNVVLSDATWANGSSFTWTSSNGGAFITGANPSDVEYIPNTVDLNAGGTVLTLTVNGENSCGAETETSQTVVTIHRVPEVNAGPENQTLCEGANTITGAQVDYEESLLWTSSGDGSFDGATSLTPIYTPGANDLVNGDVTLTLTANAFNSCSAPVQETLVFQVNAAPVANAGPNASVCANNSFTLSGASASNYSNLTWSSSGTGAFDSTAAEKPVYTPSLGDISSGFVRLTMTLEQDGCNTISDSMELTIVPEATANAGNDITICQGEQAIIGSASATNNSSVLWEVLSGSGTLQNETTEAPTYVPNPNEVGNVMLRLTAAPLTVGNVNCGAPAIDTMIISITASPTAEAGPDQTICEGDNFSFVGSGAIATNYSQLIWSTNGDGFFSDDSIEPTYSPGTADRLSGQVRLRLEALPNAPCAIPEFSEMLLTITQIPIVDAGPTSLDFCEDDTVVSLTTATAQYNDEVLWDTSGSGNFSPSANVLNPQYISTAADIANGSVVLTLTGIQDPANCGASSSDTITLNFIQLPLASAGSDAEICDDSSFTLSEATAVNFSSVTWTTSGTGFFSNNTIQNPTYTPSAQDIALGAPIELTISAVGIGPCEEVSTDIIELTLAPSPEMELGANRSLCEDTDLTINLTEGVDVINVDNSTFEWTTSGTGSFTPANTLSTVYVPSDADKAAGNPIQLTLTAQPIAPCATPISDSFELTIIENPTVDAGPDSITICETGHTFNDAEATNFDTLQWTNETGTGVIQNSSGREATYIPSPADIAAGIVTLKLTATPNNPCATIAEDEVVITIGESPIAYAGDEATICEGDTFNVSTATAENYTTVLWSSATGGSFANGDTLTPTYTPSDAEIAAGLANLVLIVQPESPCDTAVTSIMVLNIQNQPDVVAGNNTTICEGDTYQTNTATLAFTNNAIWTASSGNNAGFANQNDLNTIYTPSQADINAGFVTLRLTADAIGPCVAPIFDELVLTIAPQATITIDPDNATICATDTYTFDTTQIIEEHVESYLWTSSGDGGFSDPEEEAPTYTPGPGDIANGTATLTLSVNAAAACVNPTASDSFELNIDPIPTIDLSASATTVCFGTPLNINSSINFYDTITWEILSGGGTIISGGNSETPVYEPAVDSQTVRLKVTATGLNPCDVSVIEELVLTVTQLPEITAFAADAESCDISPYPIAGVTTNGNEASVQWQTTGTGTFDNENSPNPTYTPTLADVATGFVDLTMTANAAVPCVITDNVSDSFRLTLTLAPEVNAGANATVCAGSDYVITDATTSNTLGLTWTSNGTGTWQDQNELTATYSPSDIDITNGFIILTLTGTGNGSCTEVVNTKRIDIIPTPIVELPDSKDNCTNDVGIPLISLQLNNYAAITWSTSSTSGTFSSTSNVAPTYYPSAQDYADGQVTITLEATPLAPCLTPVSDNMVISFAQAPVVDAGVDQTVCEDQNIILAASATFYNSLQWTTDGTGTFFNGVNNTLDPTYLPSIDDTTNGSVTLTLTATGDAICDPSTDDITIVFAQNPEVIIGSDLTYCENESVTFSDVIYTNVPTNGILWETSGAGVLTGETTATPSYAPALNEIGVVEFNLTVQAETPCTITRNFTKSITYTAAPEVNAGPAIEACQSDGNITLTDATASIGAAIEWSVLVGGGSIANQNSLTPSYSPTTQDYINGEVRLELRAFGTNGCADATDELIITLTQTPVVNAGVDATICQNESYTVSDASVDNSTTFAWTTPDGTGTLVAAPNDLTAIYTPGADETGTIRLVLTAQSEGTCVDVIVDELFITVNPPTTADAGIDQQLCVGDDVALAGTTINSTSFAWSTSGSGLFVPVSSSLTAQYQPSPNDYAAGNVTLTLTSTGLAGCDIATDEMVVQFAPKPEVFAGTDAEICLGDSYDLADATVSNGENIQWTIVDGDGEFIGNANSLNPSYEPGTQDLLDGTVTLRLTAEAIDPCQTAVSDDIILTITPLPELTVQSVFDICEGSFTITGTSATNYNNIQWQLIQGSGSLQFDDQLSPVYTTGPGDVANGTVILRAVVTGLGACSSTNDQKDVTLTINPKGTVDAGAPMEACVGSPYTFANGAIASNVENIRWTHDGLGSISEGQGTMTPTYTPSVGEIGLITFTLEADELSPCPDQITDTVTLELIPNPEADAGASFTTCANSINLSGSVTNASGFSWSGGNGTFTPNNTSSLTPTYTPTAQELNQGFVSLVLTAAPKAPCGNTDTSLVTIYFEEPVTLNSGPSTASICAGDTYELETATVSNFASFEWSTNGSGTFSPSENDLTPIYTPSAADIANGEVVLQLTAVGNSDCPTVTDQLTLSIQPIPQINISDSSVFYCDDATSINITNVTGEHYDPLTVQWVTSGEGSFVDDSALNPEYIPIGADIINGVTLYVQVNGVASTTCSDAIATDEVNVIFTAAPEVFAGADAVICATEDYTIIDATKGLNTTIKWQTNGTGSFNNDTSLNAIYTPSAVDLLNNSVELTLIGTSGLACTPVEDTLILEFIQEPVVLLNQNIFTTCSSEIEVAITGITIQNEASILWTHDGQGSFKVSNSTPNQVYVPSGNDFQQGVTLTLTANGNEACSSEPVIEQITLNFVDEVLVDAGTDVTAICASESFQISNASVTNALNYEWTTNGDGNFSETTTNVNPIYFPGPNDISTGAATLRLTGFGKGNCDDVIDEIELTIDPVVDVFAGTDITLCSSDQSYILQNAFAANEQAISWSRTDGDTSGFADNTAVQTQYFFTADDKATGFVTLVLRGFGNASCSNTVEDSITISFTPEVELFAGADASVCFGSPYVIGDATINNNSYDAINWTSTGSGIFRFANTLTPEYTPSAGDLASANNEVTLIMTVTPKSSCGATPISDSMTLTIDQNITGTGAIMGDNTVCESDTTVYTVNGLTGVTNYNWIVPAGVDIVAGQGTSQLSVTFNNFDQNTTVELIVITSNDCPNSSNTTSLNVSVSANPELLLLSGNDQVSLCYNEVLTPITYELKGGANDTSIDWSVGGVSSTAPSGIIVTENTSTIEISGTPDAILNLDKEYTYSITATTLGCSTTDTKTGTLTIVATPNANLEPGSDDDQSICEGDPIDDIAYSITNADDYDFTWIGVQPTAFNVNFDSSTDVITISGTAPNVSQTTIYSYEIIPKNTTTGCSGTVINGQITVNADGELTLSSSNNNQAICEGDAIQTIQFTLGGDATNISLTSGNGADLSWLNPVINAGVVTLSGTPNANITSPTDYDYTVTTTGSGLCNEVSRSGTISVTPDPRVVHDNSNGALTQAACEGTPIDPIVFNLLDGSENVIINGLPTGINFNINGNILTISGSPSGVSADTLFNYSIEPVNSLTSCSGSGINGQITVNADGELTLTSSNNNQAICEGDAIQPIQFTLGGNATNITLTSGNGADLSWLNPVINAGVVTLSGTPNANITSSTNYDYTVTTTGSGLCNEVSRSGSISVTPDPQVVHDTNFGALTQVVCEGTAINPIRFDLLEIESNATVTVTNLPQGVYYSFIGSTIEISGTPVNATITSSFSYVVEVKSGASGCVGTNSGTIQVHAQDELILNTPGSDFNTYCKGDAIAPVTYLFAGGTNGANITWKENGNPITTSPQGISTTYTANSITVSGSFSADVTASTTYTYEVTTTNLGVCSSTTAAGSLTLEPQPKIVMDATSGQLNQQVCENEALTNIVFATSNGADAVNITWDIIPNGINGQFNSSTGLFTISGNAINVNANTAFNYTVTAENQTTGCLSVERTGTIQVFADHELSLISGSTTASQEICEGTSLPFDIVYEISGGANSAQVIGLNNTGFNWIVTGNQLVISGTSTQDISANTVIAYTVETTGNSCGNTTLAGTIILKEDSVMDLFSGSPNQTICEGEPIDVIQYQISEGYWNYSISGLPNGVSHSYDPTSKLVTLSGTPSQNISSDQTYTYTIKAINQNLCDSPELNGSISVTAGPELTRLSSSRTLSQSVCVNTEIEKISVRFTNSLPPIVSSLPNGLATQIIGDVFEITGSISDGGVYNFNIEANNTACTTAIVIPITIDVLPNFTIQSQYEAGYRDDLSVNTGTSRVKSIACEGDRTGEIKVEMSDTSYTYFYAWSGPNNYSNTTTSNHIKNLLPGTYTVNVSAILSSACSVSETFIVREPEALQIVTNEIIPASCDNGVDDGIISIKAEGGNSDFYKQLSWSYFEEESNCYSYNVSLIDVDNDGIYDIVDADIDNDGSIDIGKLDSNADGIIDAADTDLNGSIDSNYILSSVTYQNCDSGEFVNLNLNIGDFTSRGVLQGGICARPNTVSANANLDHDIDSSTAPIAAVNIEGGSTSCTGDWVQVSNLSGSSYASGLKPGLYRVNVEEIEFSTGDSYCSIEKTFELTKNEITYANIEVSDSYCIESSGYIDLDVRATSENIYFYYNQNRVPDADITILSESFEATRYRLNILNPVDAASFEIQDEYGCGIAIETGLLDISVNDPSFTYNSPEFERYGTISERSSVSFTLSGINSYDRIEWDFGDASPLQQGNRVSHQYQAEGTYDVTLFAYNASGCFKSSTQELVVGKGYSLLMPNTFTPNNDNINDRIGPVFTGLKEVNFFVFNKSGVLIYKESVSETSLVTSGAIQIIGWDGTNSDPNSNYYAYKISAIRLNDEVVTDVGTIFLLK